MFIQNFTFVAALNYVTPTGDCPVLGQLNINAFRGKCPFVITIRVCALIEEPIIKWGPIFNAACICYWQSAKLGIR